MKTKDTKKYYARIVFVLNYCEDSIKLEVLSIK